MFPTNRIGFLSKIHVTIQTVGLAAVKPWTMLPSVTANEALRGMQQGLVLTWTSAEIHHATSLRFVAMH